MNNRVKNIVKMMAVLMGLFVCGSMLAQNGNVREETARQVGLNFLRLKDENPRSDLQLTRVDAVQYPNLYVYNTSENGFIVVASDNHMEPILAYSDEGTFDKDNVSPGANFWFEMYEYAIDSIVRNNVRDVDEKITRKWEDLENGILPESDRSGYYPSSYGPLIMTNWGQGWPYNTFCPYFKENPNSRAVTGCVATALGQLLYYFNRTIPKRNIAYAFRHKASTSYSCLMLEGVYATFSSDVKNGCNMPARNYYSIGGWNQYSGNDYVAKMLLDCGLAVDMTYGEGSGAWDLQSMACNNESSAENALKTYFGFPKAFGYYKMEIPQYWTDTLKKYLCHNIPIMYGGNSNNGAHSFLCDGYDNAGLFHFNMGNYGSYNGNYYIYDIDGYNYNQTGLFVYPVADDDVHVENITVQYGENRLFPWCNDSIRISQGSSCAITDSSIIYNRPALYRLINRCQMNSTVLLLNALVVQSDTIKESAEICRHDNYTHKGFYNDHEFSISFSREETNFPGTIKTFYKPAYDDSSGEYLGICELTLTLSGEVSFIRDTLEKSICELADEYNTNYGIYDWHVDNVVIKCQGSGDYEYVKHNNNACDTVFTLHLTITEPENRKDDNVTTCTNEYTWNRNGKTYFNFGYYEEYYYCQNDSLYILHWIRSDTTTIMEERFVCFDSLPFVYRDTIINESDPGLYSYDIVEHSNDSTGCDKHYLLVLTILEDCCKPDLECMEEAIEGNDRDVQSNKETIYYQLKHYFEYRDATNLFLANALKGIPWTNIEERNAFWNAFQSLLDNYSGLMSEQAMQQLIATNPIPYVPEIFITDLAERYNRSVMYWNEGYYSVLNLPQGYNTDFINYDTASMNKAYEAYDYAIAHGFSDVKAMYDNAYELLAAEVDNIQSAVCARVTVKFTQKMTMTREAFNGTLQIFNGHESIPMEDILVDFRIEDQQGNDCTDLFQINTLSLDQISGISGDGSLAAQTNGTALVQFIPTKNAAPTQPVVYSFGGSFSFIDPFTGEGLTYPLYPVEITVNPSPDLYVDYFMQRDILGDDALTEDIVEPSVPAELGVIIHNQGAGEAKNVTLETAEPQIIDNEHGLAIDFAMYGASFNGTPRQLGLTEIRFGNIGSGQTAVGEWLFTSSLLGHFVSYEAHVIHNSSYGNQDLSLVSHLDIHELIHPIYAYGNLDDGINDFLVNDNPDAYDTPDSIYFSHGGKTSVGVVDDISFDHLVSPSDTIVTLTVEPSRVGWNYGVTDDPGMNQYNIVSCIRNNDNQVIPLNNVWLTFVTIPDGGDPVYENKLHIVDTIPVQQTTSYTLVFAKKPSNLRIFHGNEDEYWSNVANWEGYILPQADDEVLINGICELDEDAEVFSLTVAENKSLTIPDGRILTVSGSLTNADASGLVIEEGGQLMHTNTGAQGTVEKNILPYTEGTKDGWYLVSSPLAGFTNVTSVSDLLSNNYDLYYYDEPTHYWINQEYAANNFTELTNGKGYLYANNEEVMLGFEGELQSGSAIINVLLNYTDGIDLAGFNLVGNPYAHNVTSYASVNVANGCYQLNETKDDFIVSEISEENPLHPAEGFFVKATDEGASITFNSGRGAKANPGGSIRVELVENGKLIDRLIVKLEGEPLRKLSLNEIRTKVYATQDHQEVAIVNCTGNEQPVNFKASKNGEYTLNVNTNGLEFNYLHLIDNLTGADVDLLVPNPNEGPASYTFTAKTTDYASRFKLVFSVSGDADGDDAPFAFISNGNIIIVGAEAGSVLQIVDVMGRVLVSKDAPRASALSTMGMAKGVYVLRLVNGKDVKTQKIVID